MQENKRVVTRVTYRKETDHISPIVFIALLGTLFAGYLTYQKMFVSVCPLTEGCSYFLGLPTCFYGFVLFALIFILGLASMVSRGHFTDGIRFFAMIGVLFSGYFAIYDLFIAPLNILNGAVYTLLLPSCVYGLVGFIVITILSR